MKVFVGFFFLISLLQASMYQFVSAYKAKKYEQACAIGDKIFKPNRRDEVFVQAYSMSCLKSDNIDSVAIASVYIKNSKESRKNAAILSSVVAAKKLLYMSLVDGVDISSLRLPLSGHILSDIFDKYTKKEYTKQDDIFKFDMGKERHITMQLVFDKDRAKIYIKEFDKDKLEKTHIYW